MRCTLHTNAAQEALLSLESLAGANDLSINRAGVQAAKAIEREMQSDALIHA